MDPFATPSLVAAAGLIIIALIQWQRELTYTEYRTVHLIKSKLAELLDKKAEDRFNRSLVNMKKYRLEDDEFIETRDKSSSEVFRSIRSEGASPHLIATTKGRMTPDGERQLSHSQLVKFVEDGRQVEYYLFDNGDGTTDVYAHSESSIKNPQKHLKDTEQRPVEQ